MALGTAYSTGYSLQQNMTPTVEHIPTAEYELTAKRATHTEHYNKANTLQQSITPTAEHNTHSRT